MYTPPDKTDSHFISPCAAKLYEVFDSLSRAADVFGCAAGMVVLPHVSGAFAFCRVKTETGFCAFMS